MTSLLIESELAALNTLKFMDTIRVNGYAVIDDFRPVKLIASLLLEANNLQRNSKMQLAQTGNIDTQKSTISMSARGDQTYWLDSENKNISESQQAYLIAMDTLQQQLNRQLYLGLFELETHFAIYPIGAVYEKHIDQLHHNNHRILSSVLYLNENWQPQDGGALRLYLDDTLLSDFKDISPIGGRLVVFLSDQFWHEVLIAKRQRTSLTGWFRRDSSIRYDA
ncbi:MAG: 2OG-Fe(II) oxygenase [Methylophilaceae bacterium]|nr:2OG-Fe(II) oxygenase [Methyloradius sp.]